MHARTHTHTHTHTQSTICPSSNSNPFKMVDPSVNSPLPPHTNLLNLERNTFIPFHKNKPFTTQFTSRSERQRRRNSTGHVTQQRELSFSHDLVAPGPVRLHVRPLSFVVGHSHAHTHTPFQFKPIQNLWLLTYAHTHVLTHTHTHTQPAPPIQYKSMQICSTLSETPSYLTISQI